MPLLLNQPGGACADFGLVRGYGGKTAGGTIDEYNRHPGRNGLQVFNIPDRGSAHDDAAVAVLYDGGGILLKTVIFKCLNHQLTVKSLFSGFHPEHVEKYGQDGDTGVQRPVKGNHRTGSAAVSKPSGA